MKAQGSSLETCGVAQGLCTQGFSTCGSQSLWVNSIRANENTSHNQIFILQFITSKIAVMK